MVVAECQDLLLQISEQTARIETKTKLLARVAASSETARRLLVLSRLRSGLSPHLGSLSFEGQGAFAT